MKSIVDVTKQVGGDGAVAKASLVIENGFLKAKAEIAYPIEKAVKPVTDVLDNAITKLEAAIPGDWDKALLEPIRVQAKAELIKLLSEA